MIDLGVRVWGIAGIGRVLGMVRNGSGWLRGAGGPTGPHGREEEDCEIVSELGFIRLHRRVNRTRRRQVRHHAPSPNSCSRSSNSRPFAFVSLHHFG